MKRAILFVIVLLASSPMYRPPDPSSRKPSKSKSKPHGAKFFVAMTDVYDGYPLAIFENEYEAQLYVDARQDGGSVVEVPYVPARTYPLPKRVFCIAFSKNNKPTPIIWDFEVDAWNERANPLNEVIPGETISGTDPNLVREAAIEAGYFQDKR
jgi:hypothetical protein